MGVVRNMGMAHPYDPKIAGIYHPLTPGSIYPIRMAVHVRGDPLLFASQLRTVATEVDPTVRLDDLLRLDQISASDLRIYTLLFWTTIIQSAVILLLSLAGIYAVLSFIGAQRTREVGIRVALGGSPRHVAAAMFRRPMTQVALGLLIGLAFAGIISAEGMVFVVAYGSVILAICSLACIVPVRRVLRVEPAEALRAE